MFNPVIGICARWLRPAAISGLAAAVLLAAGFHVGSRTELASAHHFCANTGSPFGPFAIDTYEASDYKNLYARTFELGAFNAIAPEHNSFALPGIETGARSAGSGSKADPYIPPVLLKSIAFLESGWAQASYDPVVQYGEVGPVLTSHDCGYGLMQVTTGMQNVSNVPNLDQAMIGTHYAFNVARGARILMDKWNAAPESRPLVGSRNPQLIEDWYYALWGYNGFAYSNHPLNPSYNINRAPFSCGPDNDGFGHNRTNYPYQELVLGCVERPPTRAGSLLWNSIPVHLPELTDPKFAGPLNTSNWNACAYSLACAAMDIPTPNANHQDTTALNFNRSQVLGEPSMSLSATSVNVNVTPGNPIANLSFKVKNVGTGVLAYQVTSEGGWLKLTGGGAAVALGSDLGSQDGTVTLSVGASGLSQGAHTGTVTVRSLYAQNAPQVYRVHLTVGNPTPTPAPSGKWGDADCSGGPPNPVDALLTLRYDAGLTASTGACPPLGIVLGQGRTWGDIDCMDGVGPIDALKLLRSDSGETIEQAPGCPGLGVTVSFP